MCVIADDGRANSCAFNAELKADGIKASHSADLWSDSVVALYGAAIHGIRRHSAWCPKAASTKATWEMVDRLAAAADFSRVHYTASAIRDQSDSALKLLGISDPIHGMFMNTSDAAANMVAAWADRPNKRCPVHQVELSVNAYRQQSEVHHSVGKARGVVGHFNHSIHGKVELKVYQSECGLPQHNLTQDVITRWRSQHDMCADLRANKDPIMIYDNRSKAPGDAYKNSQLSSEDWDIVCETEGCLLPAADVSRLLEGGSYPTSNLVLPSMYFLIETSDPANSVMLPSNGGTPVKHEELHLAVQEARELFHDDLTRRWVEELAVDVERFYIICSGCDPRFKSS